MALGTAWNPLVDIGAGYGATPNPGPPPTDNNAGATMGAVMGPAPATNAAAVQGTPPLTGAHNIPLHVAFLGVAALVLIVLLRRAGFRFSVAGQIGGR